MFSQYKKTCQAPYCAPSQSNQIDPCMQSYQLGQYLHLLHAPTSKEALKQYFVVSKEAMFGTCVFYASFVLFSPGSTLFKRATDGKRSEMGAGFSAQLAEQFLSSSRGTLFESSDWEFSSNNFYFELLGNIKRRRGIA